MHKCFCRDDCIYSVGNTCSGGTYIFRGQFGVEEDVGGAVVVWGLQMRSAIKEVHKATVCPSSSKKSGDIYAPRRLFYSLCSGILAWRGWGWRWDRCRADASVSARCTHPTRHVKLEKSNQGREEHTAPQSKTKLHAVMRKIHVLGRIRK